MRSYRGRGRAAGGHTFIGICAFHRSDEIPVYDTRRRAVVILGDDRRRPTAEGPLDEECSMTLPARTNEVEPWSELIGALYDCAVDPENWDSVLATICEVFHYETCVLYVADPDLGRQRFLRTIGLTPEWAARLAAHDGHLDDLHGTIADFHSRSLDEPFVCLRDIDRQAWEKSPLRLGWAQPLGLVDFIDIIAMRQSDRFASCAFGRHQKHGPIDDDDIARMRLLAPHLRRAISIADLIDMKSLRIGAFCDALDGLSVGVVLVDQHAEIVHANRAASEMLSRTGPLAAVSGRLRTVDAEQTSRLRGAIASAAESETELGAEGISMALPGCNGTIATAHVLPLANGHLRPYLEPNASAAVFVASSTLKSGSDMAGFAESFDLSAAECRVAERLMRGLTIDESAAELRIARTTIKTHLARIFSKTGTSRQSELISLIRSVIPPVRSQLGQ